jgi:hypothetical protein
LTEIAQGAISGDVMTHDVECTHCGVLMTSWSASGSPVRYWQCPFCSRTHSSLYSEVFRHGAGARRVEAAAPAPSAGVPQATPADIRWADLKARAARWFARLEQEQVPTAARPPPAGRAIGAPAAVASGRRARGR